MRFRSCSQLILKSKQIIGETAGLDNELDALYAQLKAKEIGSQMALQQASFRQTICISYCPTDTKQDTQRSPSS